MQPAQKSESPEEHYRCADGVSRTTTSQSIRGKKEGSEKLIRRHATTLMKSEKVYAQRNMIWHSAAVQGMFRSECVDVLLPRTGAKGNICMGVRRHGPRQM